MDKKLVYLSANEQKLICPEPFKIASGTVEYVEAHFELGDNWDGFDSIKAVWWSDFKTVGTILNSQGVCQVPYEVVIRRSEVMVNLVGSVAENDVLVERLTTFPVLGGTVLCDARVGGDDPHPATPSQVEQFADRVQNDADRAETAASNAETSAQNAHTSEQNASQSAQSAHDDKIAIEEAIAEVIQQIEDFEQVQVVVNTLPPSSQATSDFTDGVLTLGIPQGVKGDTGNGIQSITKTGTSGLVDTYTITFTDGQTTTFTVTNGAKGDTGNGIQSVAKTSIVGLVDTYTITYTDGTESTFTVTNGEKGDKGDPGEVTTEQLYSILPTDTEDGNPLTIPDGADDVPMKSVTVDLEPIQDLNGYDKPWSGGNGKNKVDADNPLTFTASTSIQLGKTIPSGTTVYSYSSSHTYATEPTTGSKTIAVRYEDAGGVSVGVSYATESGSNNVTLTGDAVQIRLYANGYSYDASSGITVTVNDLMISTSAITSYEPYSNICPISGRTGVEVEQIGFNWWDEEWEVGDIDGMTGEAKTGNYLISKNYIEVFPSTSYCISSPNEQGTSSRRWVVYTYDSDKNFINMYGALANLVQIFTTPSNCKYIKFRNNKTSTTYDHDICINLSDTSRNGQYEPFKGYNTYPVSWQTEAGTVYGGTVDLVSGVLTVDKYMYHFMPDDWTFESGTKLWRIDRSSITPPYYMDASVDDSIVRYIVCDKYRAVSYSSLVNDQIKGGIAIRQYNNKWVAVGTDFDSSASESRPKECYVVMKLATPQTYQLTPQQILSLLGTNTMWTDGDGLDVVYRADIGLFVEKKLS